ncbi:MAG: TIGR02449 family protein [Hahellaceae bacterium]|nr:TIGR02449 family protein [Hahellaceae bacterium]MCP5168620.1 TIGR02449 family protein [Hahellaceae bacterium]
MADINEQQFEALAKNVRRLVKYCEQLEADNHILRQQQDDWHQERSRLMQKNDLAKNRVEAMISRLRALEHR